MDLDAPSVDPYIAVPAATPVISDDVHMASRSPSFELPLIAQSEVPASPIPARIDPISHGGDVTTKQASVQNRKFSKGKIPIARENQVAGPSKTKGPSNRAAGPGRKKVQQDRVTGPSRKKLKTVSHENTQPVAVRRPITVDTGILWAAEDTRVEKIDTQWLREHLGGRV